jgi:ATP-dependent helicase HrpB
LQEVYPHFFIMTLSIPAGLSLPAATIADRLNETLAARHAAVVVAPPGAGKSTLLPLTMLQALPEGRIVMLEPRRIAARQVALRMAQLIGEDVGATVGYQIRFDKKLSARTRVEVVTEGILTRRMTDDPTLEGVACVVFDEFHERSLQTDLAFCLARQIRDILRPDLNIVVMSATIDPSAICQALGADEISCSGKMYPVDIRHAKDDTEPAHIAADVAAAISRAHREHEGDILAFLPGQADIVRCAEILGSSLAPTTVCPLYGNLSADEQFRAIAPSPAGRRKVVLATPIAETSLTIEGVRVVIDSGYYRKLVYDAATGLSHLETVRISQDMARQRAGRAGRVAPGVCYELWTAATANRLEPQRQPEIADADLTPMVLDIAAFGETDVAGLPWLTPPPASSLREAGDELRLLHAITADGRITPLGRRMAALPCHPRVARMILQGHDAHRKALAADITAILEEKDPLSSADAHADLQLRVSALRDARRNRRLGAWARIARIASEYARMAGVAVDNAFVSGDDIGALVAAGYPERVAQAVGHNGDYRLAGGGMVALDPDDPLTGQPWIAIAALHAANNRRGRVFLAAPVNISDIAELTTQYDNITWITHQGGIIAQREQRIGQLVVQAKPLTDIDRDQLTHIVCAAVAKEGQGLLNWSDDVQTLQLRVALVAKWHPELGLPDLSTTHLLEKPEAWLPFYLDKNGRIMTTVADLKRIDLRQVLWNLLSYDQQQAVDLLAPMRIRVASGRMIKVRYRVGTDVPVLSVRLQECFGMTDTPTVNDGRVPVLMELLSPGFKPVQLTTDLRNFWQTTYFEVRKELRRRYPKHAWPEKP